MKNKTYWIVGGLAGVGLVLYLALRSQSKSAIVTAAATAAGTPTSTASTTGKNMNSTTGGDVQTVPVPYSPTVIQTPAGSISTVPLYFAMPTADALYMAPQNIY